MNCAYQAWVSCPTRSATTSLPRWESLLAPVGSFVGFDHDNPRADFLTVLFLFFAYAATQVGNAAAQGGQTGNNNTLSQVPNSGTLIYISLAFGFSLAVNAWVFFRISGGESWTFDPVRGKGH